MTRDQQHGQGTPVEYLNYVDLLLIAQQVVGPDTVVRDEGLMASAAQRPAALAYGVEAYLGVWMKAAALLHSLCVNKALAYGNKRLAWTATQVFLDLNGFPVTRIDPDAAVDFVNAVTSGELRNVVDIAKDLADAYALYLDCDAVTEIREIAP